MSLPDYRGYGLRIRSDLPLPELLPVSRQRACDLQLRFLSSGGAFGTPRRWAAELTTDTGDIWLRCARVDDGYFVRFDDADWFVRADGRLAACADARIDRDDPLMRHMALDQVIPLTLKLRGEEALHAAGVRTGAGVVALIGPSGSGKSTLAAAFLRAGDDVICDDYLRVVRGPTGPRVWPAYPGVRLWTDAFEKTDGDAGSWARRGRSKPRYLPAVAPAAISAGRLRLVRIYRLARAGRPRTRLGPLLTPRDAFMEMVASTLRFDALDRPMMRREFGLWNHLVDAVPMRRLWIEPDPAGLRARELILEDVA